MTGQAEGKNGTSDRAELLSLKDEDEDKKKLPVVGLFQLFKFADGWDRLLMVFGAIFAAANGAGQPVMVLVLGDLFDFLVDTGVFTDFLDSIASFLAQPNVTDTRESLLEDASHIVQYCGDIANFYGNITCADVGLKHSIMDKMSDYAVDFALIGAGTIICSYFQVWMWMMAAARQAHRIRNRFFENVLRQDIGWFDVHDVGVLNTYLTENILRIENGIGEKFATMVQQFSTCIIGCVIAFVTGWKLSLVIMSIIPLIVFCGACTSKFVSTMTAKEMDAYAKAGGLAEEVFSSIRTVAAFGGQDKEAERYKEKLKVAKLSSIKKGLTSGILMGFFYFVVMASFALGIWYGGKLSRDDPDDYSIGTTLTVYFALQFGFISLGNSASGLESFMSARGSAYPIFQMIELETKIDNLMKDGKKPKSLTGKLTFRNIHFSYPTRPDVKALDGLYINVNPGKTVALVGSSGCGKSTTIQLLQRFYDPQQGQVLVDGNDIKELNVRWLRSHIGVVSQEPVLFATTIGENIRYGCEREVSQQEVEEAAKNANAHDFIMHLPDKYDTLVGERGAQLSGGQKQRVAIARALVRNPKILLLDEATSALDTESEKVVQDALDKARQGRTTIVIAHRLSTIQTADTIISLKNGQAMEQGTHDELMAKQGIYHELVMNQTNESPEDEEKEDVQKPKIDMGKQVKRMLSSKLQRKLSRSDTVPAAEEEAEDEDLPNASLSRMLSMNASEWKYIVLGSISATLMGAIMPSFGVMLCKVISAFRQKDVDDQKHDLNLYCGAFLCVGVLAFIAYTLQNYSFAVSGETLTERLRNMCFRVILHKDMSFFDDRKNTTGALCNRLAVDAARVQHTTGSRLCGLVSTLSTVITALTISFYYCWQLTFFIIAFLPPAALSTYAQVAIMAGVAGKSKAALEEAGTTAFEALENIRTVVTTGRELTMHKKYVSLLERPYKELIKKAHLVGIAYGVFLSSSFFINAANFSFGSYLIEHDKADFEDVLMVIGTLMSGATALGYANALSADAGKADVSAKRIFSLLDSKSHIDSDSTEGDILPENYRSEVVFKDVVFRYPTRPEAKILRKLNVEVNQGQTVALVGSSGCGKSTTVQLIERFYDAEAGTVSLGGVDLHSLNVQHLRSQIGIVSQEPVLFNRSLAENIAYGDNNREVSMDEVISAARAANIHNFISALPNGYETSAGDKGTQLSGGQKQRVAIARALVRNPRVLLLDEATSALDTESEKIVQEALDKASEGRTCIVIAHRLSTIRNVDKICVIQRGMVTEEGTHDQLMDLQRFYYQLNMTQSSRK